MSAVGMRGDDMRVRGETKGMFLGPPSTLTHPPFSPRLGGEGISRRLPLPAGAVHRDRPPASGNTGVSRWYRVGVRGAPPTQRAEMLWGSGAGAAADSGFVIGFGRMT